MINDVETIIRMIAEYDDLVAKAIKIAGSPQYRMYCYEARMARLYIEGDLARLVWPEASSGYYSSCSIEEQSVSFPADLLRKTHCMIDEWIKDQVEEENKKRAAAQRKANRESRAKREAEEKETYERLRVKYEK